MREPVPKLGRFGKEGICAFLSVLLMPPKVIAELSLVLCATCTVVLLVLTSAPQDSGTLRPGVSKASLYDWRMLSAQQINRRTMELAAAIDASEK